MHTGCNDESNGACDEGNARDAPDSNGSVDSVDSVENGEAQEAVEEAKQQVQQVQQAEEGMTLNVAYEAFEEMRRANMQLEFGYSVDLGQCIPCLRIAKNAKKSVSRWRRNLPHNRAHPCLLCGVPVCPQHRHAEFRRDGVTVCEHCSLFFSLHEELQDSTQSLDTRRQWMRDMLDVYDRSLLILRYSSSYIPDVAAALEHNTRRNNNIGLGTSATGFVSGLAGVAAAATIFTPVGPPLLIASILFGGGATAASASSEAVNYRCAPNQMAKRILVLHGVLHSISSLVPNAHKTQPKENSIKPQPDTDKLPSPDASTKTTTTSSVLLTKAARDTKTNSSRNWTRATANALKPLTAGALSAASVVMEAREMKSILNKIRAGHLCDTAEALRTIQKEVDGGDVFPKTEVLAENCRPLFLEGVAVEQSEPHL